MAADSFASGWLLFLVQLPSKPSSARVALWRRLRAIGATTMVNGAWVLPDTAAHAALFGKLRERVLRQGGTAFVLSIPGSPPEMAAAIVQAFRADRAREYDEFAERCTAFLDEIGKEAGAGKYTFAEMEEGEQDLEKLARWLKKIQARDFFPDDRRQQSFALMARCRDALEGFSHAVYVAEGVQETAEDVSRPARRRPPPPAQRGPGVTPRGREMLRRLPPDDPADVLPQSVAGLNARATAYHGTISIFPSPP